MIWLPENFHFLRPHWFWLLPVLALLIWGIAQSRRQSRGWSAVCDPGLLTHLLVGTKHKQDMWLLLFVAIGGLLSILALAGPAWERLPQPVFQAQSSLVMVLDLSRSMDATDIRPSRLKRVRLKLLDILERRKEGQTALVVYTNQAYTVSPLTQDTATISALIPSLSTELMPSQGSRPDIALQHAVDLLQQAGRSKGEILFITDDIPDRNFIDKISDTRDQGFRTSVLGVGTSEGAPIPQSQGGFLKSASGEIVIPKLDAKLLQQVAVAGGGRYSPLQLDDSDLNYLKVQSVSRDASNDHKETELQTENWREQGPWLLLPLLILGALAFRRGWLLMIVVFVLPVPFPVQAADWQGLWKNRDQQGSEQLQLGNAEQAAKLFQDPQWRASAQYKAGQFEQAIQSLDGIETADALYNKANAMVRSGQFEQAINTYEQALELNPKLEDAIYNRDLIKKMLEQQQQQQQQQQQSSDSDSQSSEQTQQQDGESQSSSQQAQQDQQASDTQDQKQDQQSANAQDAASESEQEQNQQAKADPSAGEESPPQDQPQRADTSGEQAESEPPPTSQAESAQAIEAEDEEMQQAMEQWLRRVPDDPGGLLRRKFLYQYKRRDAKQNQEQQPW